jgi:transcriptional regulator with XRE-family HTH domain
MTISFEQVFQEFSPEERAAIIARAEELKREELNLREMRRLRKLTQARLSRRLKIGQEGVSRIEKRTDLYLSTLRGYVEGLGGKLKLIVEFPNRPPLVLTGFGEDAAEKKPRKKTPKASKSKAPARRAA